MGLWQRLCGRGGICYLDEVVEARTKLLVTLSDGKPDDYRGEYGIEDTRQALIEARRSDTHAFCITIVESGTLLFPAHVRFGQLLRYQ